MYSSGLCPCSSRKHKVKVWAVVLSHGQRR